MWKQGASVAINFQIQDLNVFGTGVFFPNGNRSAARAFAFPFVVHGHKGHTSQIWGRAPQSGTLSIQRKTGSSWRTIKKLHVKAGGVFTTKVRAPKSAKLQAVVGGATSFTARRVPSARRAFGSASAALSPRLGRRALCRAGAVVALCCPAPPRGGVFLDGETHPRRPFVARSVRQRPQLPRRTVVWG